MNAMCCCHLLSCSTHSSLLVLSVCQFSACICKTFGDKSERCYFSGGAQIIDMMVLVVDVTKGMQTQTAECLVIGEILCNKMIVVLNKIDLLNLAKRNSAIEKVCLCYQVNIL